MTFGGYGSGPNAPFAGDPFAGAPNPVEPPTISPQQPGTPTGETNTLATLSVVFAFILAPVGAILGHLGLAQIQRTGQRGRDRALVGITLSYVFITAAVAALIVGTVTDTRPAAPPAASPATSAAPSTAPPTTRPTSPKPPPPPPKVDAAGLAGLLPKLQEVKDITGNPELIGSPPSTSTDMPPADVVTFEPVECVSSFAPALPPAYKDSGYRAVYSATQIQSPRPSLQTSETVATFDDPAAAQKALANYIELWRKCANTRFQMNEWKTMQYSMWTLGAPEDAGGGITTLRSINDASPVSVTRAIAAKNNVLVDIWLIGSALSDQNVTLAKRVLDAIPG